ncbi:MAG: hypothetical protein WCI18_11765 [Pseudomonadota bacterium]
MKLYFPWIVVVFCTSVGCIELHSVQVGDIVGSGKKLKVEVSDLGIDMDKSLKLAGRVTNKNESAQKLSSIIALFQYGPRTGNVIYRPQIWTNISPDLRAQCMNGEVNGLISTREFRNFNFVSTEMARVTGYCTGE